MAAGNQVGRRMLEQRGTGSLRESGNVLDHDGTGIPQ